MGIDLQEIESSRLRTQVLLDSAKTALERNKSGQFATPPALSSSITRFVIENYLGVRKGIKFLEPALGTGSFYSALLSSYNINSIKQAVGIEYDKDFFKAAKNLWKDNGINIINDNFLSWNSSTRFDLILTNPPYVRHHYINEESKHACKCIAARYPQLSISGLSGLYVYFLIHSVSFMNEGGIGVWLIPSEWMNVNYGKALRDFLTNTVKLLHIHNYNITEVKFDDALVSSSVVIFENTNPNKDSLCKLSHGSDINNPSYVREISNQELNKKIKWLNLFIEDPHPARMGNGYTAQLGDFFSVKRGIATGSNDFFIKPKQFFEGIGVPSDFIKPILPPSRELKALVIESDRDGYPKIENAPALLDTTLSLSDIKKICPRLFSYLTSEKAKEVSASYLASRRTPWYSQEQRPPAPFICTYMGRDGKKGKKIFRFFYNKSKATATNSYLLLIPKPQLAEYLKKHPDFSHTILDYLNSIPDQQLISNGRHYGGGLYKMEPKELSAVDASFITESFGFLKAQKAEQLSLFSDVQERTSIAYCSGATKLNEMRSKEKKAAAKKKQNGGRKAKKKSQKTAAEKN
jgi:adenine-specific DNA-methyltransferase